MTITKNDMHTALTKMKDKYRIASGDEIKSPKDFLFPRTEKLLYYDDGEAVECFEDEPTVVFGIRPCDLQALYVMGKVFTTGKFGDPYFSRRLDNTLFIGLACPEKKKHCFCDKLAVDMNYSEKCDLFLTEADENEEYSVLYISDKGREKFADYFSGIADFKNQDTPKTTAPHTPTLSLPHDSSAVLAAFENKIDWEKITEICLGCGLCTFICPSCHCFDFKDSEEDGTSSRYRVWDSCMFSKFTLHASGHNPRMSKSERYRQRILHKFVYIPQNTGETACTGCGRCVKSCPAGMNLPRIVEGLMEELR